MSGACGRRFQFWAFTIAHPKLFSGSMKLPPLMAANRAIPASIPTALPIAHPARVEVQKLVVGIKTHATGAQRQRGLVQFGQRHTGQAHVNGTPFQMQAFLATPPRVWRRPTPDQCARRCGCEASPAPRPPATPHGVENGGAPEKTRPSRLTPSCQRGAASAHATRHRAGDPARKYLQKNKSDRRGPAPCRR